MSWGGSSNSGGYYSDGTPINDPNLGDTASSSGSGGIDWTKISGALKDASKTLGGADSSGSSGKSNLSSGSGVVGQSSSTTGRPTAAVSLDNLMKMLEQRQQGYATSAMSPQSAQPQTQQRTSYGLLGY